ncbi:PAS domain S-box protein [Noviherbaspirillum malthae]|jgi:PAS domain S-box-containing protein|uniref:PAS domain S-box protein n=1 Tax=Noviherbaspirillum malthae TaxID=1260987 RepID=UPI00188F77A6|nr:PAS domain-containing sensor histidine kinase [Noviherbaspirillum malthae]
MITHPNDQPADFNSLRRIQLLVEKITDYAIYMLSPEGLVTTWNAGAARFKGYSSQEIIGQHFSRFYSAEDQMAGIPAKALATAIREGKFEAEGWRYRKDGSRFWASVVIDPIFDNTGVLVGFAKITRDITDKKRVKDALHASEENFRLLVQSVVDYAIYMLSPTGEITNWNTGAQRIKGYSTDEVVGTHFSRFYTDEDRAKGLPAHGLETARSTGRFEAEGWRVRKDGTRFYASVVIDAIHNDDGVLIGFAKITRDVSERRMLEETRSALERAQRLESIGKLTGGVAHDFNNILQVIGGNLQLLMAAIQGNEAAHRHAQVALNAVERGGKLSSQLLAFARRQPLQPIVINMGRVLRGMEDLLRRALGETIGIETIVSGGLWNAVIDPHQLENVILNLAINARDAMPGGGKLTIELGNSVLDDAYVTTVIDVPAGQYVMLAITDTGTGMTKEVLERAVEPFFTTKPEGQGTGLGLSMAFGFAKQSNGHFRIYSELGHGTTIKIYFPRSHEGEEILSAPIPTKVTGGTETILVVEDDLTVQQTVVEMLSSLGYKVLKADNATTALAVLKAGVHCDLLFTDVVMPGELKSPDLVRQAKALLPSLEVLYTSGYTQNAIIHGGRLDPGVQLLSKPYRREELALKVHQILKGRAREAQSLAAMTILAERGSAPRASARRVLVVEDMIDSQEMTCELLHVLGHSTQAVASAEDALKLLSEGHFDVLLTDYQLPGMDGLALARKARLEQPQLEIIFSSGYGDIKGAALKLGAKILTKPFDLDALRTALK